jgi:WD40 repeat protein
MNNPVLWMTCPIVSLVLLAAEARAADASPPEAVAFVAHSGTVMALAYSPPDGKLLASADGNGLVLLREVASRRLVRRLVGPAGLAPKLAFSPGGKFLAASAGETVRGQHSGLRVWEVATGRLTLSVEVDNRGFTALAFSPDDTLLAVAGWTADRLRSTLRFWDTSTWKERPLIEEVLNTPPSRLVFTSDGKRLVACDPQHLHVWEMPVGKRLVQENQGYDVLALQPGGKLIAVAKGGAVQLRELEGGKAEPLKVDGYCIGLAFSPDGRTLAVVGDGVRLWDAQTRAAGRNLLEKQQIRGGVAWSPDIKRLAVSFNADIRVFDPGSGDECGLWPGQHSASISAVAWAAGGRHIVTGGSLDRRLIVWDAQTGGPTALFALPGGTNRIAVSADGSRVAAAAFDFAGKTTLKAWDVAAARELLNVPLQVKNRLLTLSLSPDGKRLALCGEEILVYELGKQAEPLKLPGNQLVAFSHDGRLLAGVQDGVIEGKSADSQVRLWDVESGKERFSPVKLGAFRVRALDFSLDGARLLAVVTPLANFERVKVELDSLDTRTGERSPRLLLRDLTVTGTELLALNPGGMRLAVVINNNTRLRVYEGRHGSLLQELVGPVERSVDSAGVRHEAVSALAFSPDGQRLLAAIDQRGSGSPALVGFEQPNPGGPSLRVLPLRTSYLEAMDDKCPGPVTTLVLSPDGKQFALAGPDGQVQLRKPGQVEESAPIAKLAGPASGLCFAAGGTKLYCAGGPTGRAGLLLPVTLPDGKVMTPGHRFQGPVHALAGSPDGQWLAVSGDGGVLTVETATNRATRRLLHDHAVLALAFHPDNRQVACGCFGSISVWDAPAGQWLFRLPLQALPTALAFSPDGRLLAGTGSDGVVRVWDLTARKEIAALERHTGRAWCLAWHPGGKLLVSGGGELDQAGEIVVWGVGTARRALELTGHHGPIRSLAFHPDGRLVSAGWDGTVKFWRVPADRLAQEEADAELAARWRIEGKELVLALRDGQALFVGDPKWTDYTVEVEGMVTYGRGELNVFVRADGMDENTRVILGGWDNRLHAFLIARPGSKQFELLPLTEQKKTAIEGRTEPSRWYAIRVEVRGQTAEVFLDGKPLMKTEAIPQKHGNVGLHGISTAARFRNLKVTGPDGKVLFEGLPGPIGTRSGRAGSSSD